MWSRSFIALYKSNNGLASSRQLPIFSALLKYFLILQKNSRWIIDRGAKVQFWTDRWLDKPVVDLLSSDISRGYKGFVAAFIEDDSWCIPQCFQDFIPHIAARIQHIFPPRDPIDDILMWVGNVVGELTFAEAYCFYS